MLPRSREIAVGGSSVAGIQPRRFFSSRREPMTAASKHPNFFLHALCAIVLAAALALAWTSPAQAAGRAALAPKALKGGGPGNGHAGDQGNQNGNNNNQGNDNGGKGKGKDKGRERQGQRATADRTPAAATQVAVTPAVATTVTPGSRPPRATSRPAPASRPPRLFRATVLPDPSAPPPSPAPSPDPGSPTRACLIPALPTRLARPGSPDPGSPDPGQLAGSRPEPAGSLAVGPGHRSSSPPPPVGSTSGNGSSGPSVVPP